MKNTIFPILITIILTLIILNKLTSSKSTNQKALNSPFECGFNNISSSKVLLSHNFFMFNLLFLILELEIILIIPFTPLMNKTQNNSSPFFITMAMILITMIKEWNNKIIDWSK